MLQKLQEALLKASTMQGLRTITYNLFPPSFNDIDFFLLDFQNVLKMLCYKRVGFFFFFTKNYFKK
jgi:hypothetical protein